MVWYYRYELKSIQPWILDSNRLRELQGGSKLIEALEAAGKRKAEAAKGTVLYAAAGGMTAVFPDREWLQAFSSEWPMHVYHAAPGMVIVQAWLEAEEDAATALRDLARRLVERRNSPLPLLPEAGPWVKRVGRTGQAAVRLDEAFERDAPQRKHGAYDRAGVEKERAFRTTRQQDQEGDDFYARISDEELERWPEGMVAVIHADGSGIGQRIHTLGAQVGQAERTKAHQRFSRALDKVTKEAGRAAWSWLEREGAQRWSRLRDGTGRLYARRIVEGGDDLTVLVPASAALGFVTVWLQAFEDESTKVEKELGGKPLHAAAGIAFVHKAHPFWRAYEIAETACGAAKKDLAEDNEPAASGLRMVRLTSSLGADDTPSDAAKTWSLAQLGTLQLLADTVGRLPRGGLRSWLTLAESAARAPERGLERDRAWGRLRELALAASAEGADEGRSWDDLGTCLPKLGADPETGLLKRGPGAPEDESATGKPMPVTPLADALALAHLQRNEKRQGEKR